jgi:hypothetical protein
VERYDGGEVNGRVVEGDEPDTEDLENVDVEDEVGFIKCCEILSAICSIRGWLLLANRLHADIDARAHDLVPPIYGCNEPSRVAEAASPTEGMCERGIGCKVFLNSFALNGWRRLREKMDDSGYLFDC